MAKFIKQLSRFMIDLLKRGVEQWSSRAVVFNKEKKLFHKIATALLHYCSAALIIAIALLVYCYKSPQASEAQDKKGPAQALEVSVYKVQRQRSIPIELRYPARTKSISRVTVVARVGGILKEMYFREGQSVQKDDLLYRIEPDIYQAEYDSAKAQVELAIAELNKAERDWKRIKASYEDKVASEQQRDTALSAYEQAKASLESAKARLKQAEINLGYTEVRAPVSGIIGTRLVDPGNMVNPNTALVTITEINPIFVEFSIPDTDLQRFGNLSKQDNYKATPQKIFDFLGTPSLKAEIQIEDRPYRHSGRLDFIDSVIDEKTSSVSARAVFPNPDGILLPGQFVRITLKGLQRKAALVIPQKGVLQTPLGPAVYVVENGRAVMKNIKIGEKTGEDFIVEEGLRSGDIVIVDNLMKLRPDMPVRVRQ